MADALHKFPRLFVPGDLGAEVSVPLDDAQAHYIRTVMRREAGSELRLFNGRDGEWLGTLNTVGKKDAAVALQRQLKNQPQSTRRVHLVFAPLKKDRQDMLIEKAVELGVTDLHPVITDRTEVREIKTEKLQAQIMEAAEQCERLTLPTLHPIRKLDQWVAAFQGAPVFAGLERSDAKILADMPIPEGDVAALIGPAGGWTDDEREFLSSHKNVQAVSLGANILRAETAALVMLVALKSL